ncbi:DNA repair protein RadC [Proteiniclasticum sp. QWL-01]|uniref:RadC family protein n=1 Tax=Proteiniclasticum sp. QWL-01 TaxID=3036945 RepID=UPI0021FB0869|nr:DNA repair protein RadC [Proteiniclasticum sp. QWL-01]UUM13181.1 DNA repair protein RadC [Clostridiaceae bacterium HFYG-1003]WFF71607.1 DNA repair protein RadC [Proteiniclasticum sp. QWL-01]
MEQRVRDLPAQERPQERLEKYGAQSLSNAELLAVILRTGTARDGILNLSARLLKDFGGLNGVLEADLYELTQHSGIKAVKATQILAVAELAKRYRNFRSGDEYRVSSPKDAADLVMNEMRDLKKEILKVLILNTKNIVTAAVDASVGTLSSSIVHPRDIFRDAIRRSAASIILIHNHPSGDPTPSGDDINSTRRVKEAGKIVGIELLDHLIIGDGRFISLKEKGYF